MRVIGDASSPSEDRVAPGNLRYVVAIVCACSNFAWRKKDGFVTEFEKPDPLSKRYFMEKNVLDNSNRIEHAICKVFFLRGHGRILRKIIIDYFSEFQKFRVEE